MKKIIFIQQTGVLGGSGISLLNTVDMIKENFDVTVYCPASPQDLTNVLRENGIKVINYNFQIGSFNYYSGGPKLITRSFFLGIKNIILNREYWTQEFMREKPDIIAVNSMILAWMAPLIKKAGASSICFVRETLPSGLNLIRNAILRAFLNSYTGVAFLSKFDMKRFNLNKAKSVIIKDCLPKKSKLETLPNGNYWAFDFERKKLNALFVGGYDPIKGLHIVLKALKKLKGLSCQLIVAGYTKDLTRDKKSPVLSWWRNRYARKIQRLLEDKEIRDKVKIIGLQNDMSIVFNSCDLLIFPSIVPHQSRPAFEIGLYSKPVIISDFPQTKEYIIENKNGLVFKPNCPSELADKINWLYNNEDGIINKLGERNLEMTKELHAFSTVKRDLLYFLSKLN